MRGRERAKDKNLYQKQKKNQTSEDILDKTLKREPKSWR